MGDKTQLVALSMASRYRRPWTVLLGRDGRHDAGNAGSRRARRIRRDLPRDETADGLDTPRRSRAVLRVRSHDHLQAPQPMTDLVFARSQMAMSLAFHITFAAVGIGMPLLMAIAEGLHLRSRAPIYLDLARRWARGTAILFAVGAGSGTVLSFELGLLWPRFMEYAGGIIGMPFSLEAFAFFAEAIFLGIDLYAAERISPVV